MKWKGYGRKWTWPNLRYFPGVCMERMREITKNLSQDSRSPGEDLNPGPHKYEKGVVTVQTQCSKNSEECNRYGLSKGLCKQ
jgi:hypothetical protein